MRPSKAAFFTPPDWQCCQKAERDPFQRRYIFSQMFSPTIMLLIGGFTIAAVLSKTRLDVMTATRVLNAAGTRPSVVLLCLMFVATFASMWISNVAAPTLCYALIKVR
jgi:phosphate transporter